MKLKFVHLLALSAAILVCSAGYFSVTGFAKLFSGATLSIIILISGLELAKLVVTSFLYRYWNNISLSFKGYLLIAVTVLMIITSAGIYGFLSSAYSVTSDKLSKIDGNIKLFDNKKQSLVNYSDRIKNNIEEKNKRSQSLVVLRVNQESRLDTLYKKGLIQSAKRTEQIIKEANDEIVEINKTNDSLNRVIQTVLDSVGRIDIKILSLNDNDVKGDIGPLKYIASLTHKSIDEVVNFFILLLVFISDPLAVCLVIATNKILLDEKKINDEQQEENKAFQYLKKHFKKIKNIFI